MVFANEIKIEERPDHFVIHFLATSGETTTEVAAVAVPLLAGIELSLSLFKGMIGSIIKLQVSLADLQVRINDLNRLAAEAQQKAAAQVKK